MNVLLKGTEVELKGTQPVVGEKAPDFSLPNLSDEVITLSDLSGKPVIISVVPDIDTAICALQTKRFNEEAANLDGVSFVTISNNTKEQQATWCGAEGVDMTMLRDETGSFAESYGLLIPAINRLARAIYVVDQNGVITYTEITPEVSMEPDYTTALTAATALI